LLIRRICPGRDCYDESIAGTSAIFKVENELDEEIRKDCSEMEDPFQARFLGEQGEQSEDSYDSDTDDMDPIAILQISMFAAWASHDAVIYLVPTVTLKRWPEFRDKSEGSHR
jgi:hypothetical protein